MMTFLKGGSVDPEPFLMAKMMSNFPKFRGDLVSRYIHNSVTWNSKQPVFYGCFNGKIPNHYIKNGCFTKHPFKTGCLEFQVHISLAMLEPFVEGGFNRCNTNLLQVKRRRQQDRRTSVNLDGQSGW